MSEILDELYRVLQERKSAGAEKSYVASLYAKGPDAILKKLGEEATEVVIAAKSGEHADIVHEMADLWFHSMVLLASEDIDPNAVLTELSRRFGRSGLEEKASRQQQ